MSAPDRTLLLRAGLVVLTLVLGAGAYALGTNLVNQGAIVDVPDDPAPAQPVTFADERAGIEITYPGDWTQVLSNAHAELGDDEGSHLRLIAGPSADEPMLKVRVVPLPEAIDFDPDMSATELGVIQGSLDDLIEGPNVEIVSRKPINKDGLLGFHYLYAFKESSTGREGVHSHYFFFDGAKMNALIFEALPRDRFEELAATFDEILNSFQSVRRPAPGVADELRDGESSETP